jgi:hypothetical protein
MLERRQRLDGGKNPVVGELAADLVLLALGSAVEQEHVDVRTKVRQVPGGQGANRQQSVCPQEALSNLARRTYE